MRTCHLNRLLELSPLDSETRPASGAPVACPQKDELPDTEADEPPQPPQPPQPAQPPRPPQPDSSVDECMLESGSLRELNAGGRPSLPQAAAAADAERWPDVGTTADVGAWAGAAEPDEAVPPPNGVDGASQAAAQPLLAATI